MADNLSLAAHHSAEMSEVNNLDEVTIIDDTETNQSSKRRKTSGVWEHYKVVEESEGKDKKAQCNYCSAILSCKSNSGTSHLKRHAEKHNLVVSRKEVAHNEVYHPKKKVVNEAKHMAPKALPPPVNDVDQKKDFAQDQIWAVFGGSDSMPQQYVKVNSIVSVSLVSVTYLEPHPILDDEIHWVEESLPFVCGMFRIGLTTTCLETCMFSHLVECEPSTRKSFYKIYPRQGEVWAMYRNWHNKWDLSNHEGYQCEVVEILQDFNEEAGTSVCRLVSVNGCSNFFQRQLYEGYQLVRFLSRTEMLSFSHRIPHSTVVGTEKHILPVSVIAPES